MRVKSLKPKTEKPTTDPRANKQQLSVDAPVAKMVRAVAKNEGKLLSDFIEEAVIAWCLVAVPGKYDIEVEGELPHWASARAEEFSGGILQTKRSQRRRR